YCFEAMKRNGVLYPGIMSIKGDDVVNSHTDQFLKAQSAVQRFPAGSLVLTALIQERHDNVDSPGFPSYSGNDPFQILKMVIRRHVIGVAAERIGQGIVADIHHEIEVVTADRFLQDTFGFS